MNATAVTELPVACRPVSLRRSEETPSFSKLVAQHTVELPEMEWLTRLRLETPRKNVQCLSLSLRICKRAFDIVAVTLPAGRNSAVDNFGGNSCETDFTGASDLFTNTNRTQFAQEAED